MAPSPDIHPKPDGFGDFDLPVWGEIRKRCCGIGSKCIGCLLANRSNNRRWWFRNGVSDAWPGPHLNPGVYDRCGWNVDGAVDVVGAQPLWLGDLWLRDFWLGLASALSTALGANRIARTPSDGALGFTHATGRTRAGGENQG